MPISREMYVWGDRAKNVPKESGVYALYNEAKALIYIGASVNLQERFTHYLETNFSKDPRKRETKYYKRELTSKQEDRMKNLLDEYRQKHDKLPKCNLPPEPPKEVPSEWGFYFYEDIGKPLFETAFNPKDLKEQITRARMSSNPTPTGLTYLDPNNVPMLKTTLFFQRSKNSQKTYRGPPYTFPCIMNI